MRALLPALLFLAAAGGAPESRSRPHIVFILTDDMGYGDPGCYGGKLAPTPNLDRMAAEGLRLAQYTSAAPVCSRLAAVAPRAAVTATSRGAAASPPPSPTRRSSPP